MANLAQQTGAILLSKRLTLSVCESCTGGMLGSMITSIPGSSNYFKGGVIAYSNELKIKLAQVRKKTLQDFGAVSRQTAREMAEGTKAKTGSDLCLAITGIAGPGGGTKTKPVGLVYIGLALPNKTIVKKFFFKGNRAQIRKQACFQALKLLIQNLKRKNEDLHCN
ncbi:MAG: CinA family protein [candidate division WOR-3 bacterium]